MLYRVFSFCNDPLNSYDRVFPVAFVHYAIAALTDDVRRREILRGIGEF